MQNNLHRKLILLGSVVLALVWAVTHLRQSPVDDPDWMVRLTLGILLAFGLLASRPPQDRHAAPGLLDRYPMGLPMLAAAAALLSIIGLILPVRQFEWLGLVLLLYAAVRWALPVRYRWNIAKAFFLFYWVHPLPGQIFAPFQMWMQRMSVAGAEWFLHGFNHRVWADGFVLRMAGAEFGVPEACSGMRTAVTVLLCTLGVGMLLRMRWHETLAFLALGVAQVLALNILRIGSIVHFVTRGTLEVSETVLHDTAGIFLLISIVVVQAEMVWWRSFSTKRREYMRAWAAGDANPPPQSSFLPPFWRAATRYAIYVLVFLLTVAVVAAAAYKRRPAHRSAMISGVIQSLLHEDPVKAERAAAQALELTPDDRDLLSFKVQALVRSERYEQALRLIDTLDQPLTHMDRAMKSASLAALGRIDEAAEVLETLPEDILRSYPMLAMFRAEYAALVDDPATVAEYLRYAAVTYVTIPRVRALYPYLARREQWRVIADTHHTSPYRDLDHVLLAIHANLTVNRPETAGRILRQAYAQWPDEIRLIGDLARFAARNPDSEWEEWFETAFRQNLERLDVDRLSTLISYGFRMRRPDLAWRAWWRLEELDPDDPALFLTAARHAGEWFVFRRRQVGMSARHALETIDMRERYRQDRDKPGFAPHWNRVPLAETMVDVPLDTLRERYLRRALNELKRRDEAGEMTQRLHRMYPVVLGLRGHAREAQERLNALAAIYPEMEAEILREQALNHERRAEWQRAYEKIRRHMEVVEFPSLRVRLMYVNATLNMGAGPLALRTARNAVREFPDANDARTALAICWDAFGFSEQALFILSRLPDAERLPFYPQLLYNTGRYEEARRLARVSGVSLREEDVAPVRVVPAEATVRPRVSEPPSSEVMNRAADRAAMLAGEADSPFMAGLRRLEAEWFAAGGTGAVSSVDRWLQAGRDPQEETAAAYHLAVLLLRQQRFDEALHVVDTALDRMDDCLVLWRLRVSLSGGDPEIAAAAHRRFPDDPEFWLAKLVTRTQREAPADDGQALDAWARDSVQQAVDAKRFSPGDMVRAADFLVRQGMPEAAAIAARYAIDEGRGLETAYIVGLRCALTLGDTRWALSCALGGADHARDPQPFYQMLVNLNFAEGTLDRDLVAALQYLREHFPQESLWTEQLGTVHFLQGDPGRALGLLMPLIRSDDPRGVRISSLILAAEAARLEQRPRHAVSILEAGLEAYPENYALLNNLIYVMARQADMRERALELLPRLVQLSQDRPETLDTIAVVYLESGQYERAERYIERALELIDESAYAYPYLQMTKAEVLLARGETQAGLRMVQEIVANPDYPSQVRDELRERANDIGSLAMDRNLARARELLDAGDHHRAHELLGEIMRSPYSRGETSAEARRLRGQTERLR